MKKSFTVIEVIIAVVILSLVGAAIIRAGSINAQMMEKIEKKEPMTELAAIVANHRKPQYNHLTKRLEDFLEIRIEDDELRKFFKTKVKYDEREVKLELPKMDENESGENILGVSLVKITIQKDGEGESLFVLDIDG
jgi:hypothetical protein